MPRLVIPTLHEDQVRAYRLKEDAREGEWTQNAGGRFEAIVCGRRWGKTTLGEAWLGDGAIKGMPCGWFAPDYKRISEVYLDLHRILLPIKESSSKVDGSIRTTTGGTIDFWTLNDESAGRSRKYKRVFIDEAAFTAPNMMDIWDKAIKPTLLDYTGRAKAASNANGIDRTNFLWRVCNQPEHGFIMHHAPSWNNPLVPLRFPGEEYADWKARQDAEYKDIRDRTHPLVFQQEYEAKFVDWRGVAFFSIDKMLVGEPPGPIPWPVRCDYVYAIIDSAAKTGKLNDGTAVTYFARTSIGGDIPLVVLDWDYVQIEGALLETWLPTIQANLEALARDCGARRGSAGIYIEDKSSGEVLNQQARRRGIKSTPIDSRLTAMGKDERALSVSGYHYRGEVKISAPAFDKVTTFKGTTENHFLTQVTGFRMADPDAAKRADDLLDTYTYGVAVGLGDPDGW